MVHKLLLKKANKAGFHPGQITYTLLLFGSLVEVYSGNVGYKRAQEGQKKGDLPLSVGVSF